MMTEELAVQELLDHEGIVNDEAYTHATWSAGDRAHQGDIIFVGLAKLPASAKKVQQTQLAEGNTQGSRHVLEGGTCYRCDEEELARLIQEATKREVGRTYLGPVFTCPATVTHPEHGDHIFPHQGVVAVVYQRSLDAEEREARVRD